MTAKIQAALEEILLQEAVDVAMVQGDTNTVLAGALIANKLGVRVAHVEAGLRSFDWSMPEEINRVIAGHLSHYHFAPTPLAKENLLKEGVKKEKIFVTGNTIVDALKMNLVLAKANRDPWLDQLPAKYSVLTLHRPSNVDNADFLKEILGALASLNEAMFGKIIFLAHPRTSQNLKEANLETPANIMICQPVDYFTMLNLLDQATLVLTDSGGLQEEACVLGKPCLTLRPNTERPESITVGANILVKNIQDLPKLAEEMLGVSRNWSQPFGDGLAAQRIVKTLLKDEVRLFYVANIRIPTEKAHGSQIMKMCELFASRLKTQLLVPRRLNPEYKNIDIFEHYHIAKKFSIKKLPVIDPRFILKIVGSYYIKFQLLFFNITLFFYLLFQKKKKADIFYTRDEYLLPLLQLFSKRVVWEAHSLPRNVKFYLPYIKKCHRLIVLTQQIKKDLIRLGVAAHKILVSPDAVDLNIFNIDTSREEARQGLGLPQDKIILGYTGSLLTKGMDKGIKDIIAALKILWKRYDNLMFLAVGGSPVDIAVYQNMAQEAGVADMVRFINKVSQEKLALYQRACDILLMPFPNKPHYAFYMSPLKLFEYMASGRPIISSDLPSLREVLDEGKAIFCQPDNPQSLANKVEFLLADRELGKQLGQQAQLDVRDFTWEKRAQKIISFIK